MTTTHTIPDLACHPIAHTTVAAVLVRDDKVFLLRRSKEDEAYASMWDLPWVDVPAGSSPEEALVPGLLDGLGIETEAFHLLSAQDDLIGGVCWRRFVYRVSAFEGEVCPPDTHRWYAAREFADVFQLNPLVAGLPLFSRT